MLSSLLGGKVVLIASLVVILGLGGTLALRTHDLKKAREEVKQLTSDNTMLKANNETLKSNLAKATDANKSTVQANRKLLEEREDARRAIAELARKEAQRKTDLAAANAKIDELLKDPKNNGVVAPVLKETLKDIQNRRKK